MIQSNMRTSGLNPMMGIAISFIFHFSIISYYHSPCEEGGIKEAALKIPAGDGEFIYC
jgi:hypothetical protein